MFWSSCYFTSIPCCPLFSTADIGRRLQSERRENSEQIPLTPPQAGYLTVLVYVGGTVSSTTPAPTRKLHLGCIFHQLTVGLWSPGISHPLCPCIPRSESIFLLLLMFGLPHPPFFGFLVIPSGF